MQLFWQILTGFDTAVILIAGGLGGRMAYKLSKAASAFKGFGANMGKAKK